MSICSYEYDIPIPLKCQEKYKKKTEIFLPQSIDKVRQNSFQRFQIYSDSKITPAVRTIQNM